MIKPTLEGAPIGWSLIRQLGDGMAYRRADGLQVILTTAREQDGKIWKHVSCSWRDHLPSWEDLKAVKATFMGNDREAIQVLPRLDRYVNQHPFCLHLFECLEGSPIPDFTRGGKSL